MKKAWGIMVAGLLACASMALAGEIIVRNVTTDVSGEWTHRGGGVLLLKAVQSTATGGVLTVKHDLMVGGAGTTTRVLGNETTVSTSRVVSDLPSDVYILNGQKITLTNSTAVAEHTVYLFLEKVE